MRSWFRKPAGRRRTTRTTSWLNSGSSTGRGSELRTVDADLENELNELTFQFRQGREEHESLQREIVGLRRRQSNIPSGQVSLRAMLCGSVAPPGGRHAVCRRIDPGAKTNATGKARPSVCCTASAFRCSCRTRTTRKSPRGSTIRHLQRSPGLLPGARSKGGEHRRLHCDRTSLVRKLAVKPDSGVLYLAGCRTWHRRFDFACCETLTQFRREKKAVTRSGQIKAGGGRHEKDDRHRIGDRSRYVLGWSKQGKIDALEKQAGALATRCRRSPRGRRTANRTEPNAQPGRLADLVKRRGEFSDFRDTRLASRWRWTSNGLQDEKAQLEAGSDILR